MHASAIPGGLREPAEWTLRSPKVMVISDPKASKAAAAMSVDIGAASDPPGLPGLAHFCEHMLFLGASRI